MVMAQSIPSVQITPGYLSVICHLGGPSRKPLPGGGAFVISSRSSYHRSLINISLKNMPIWIAIDISLKIFFIHKL